MLLSLARAGDAPLLTRIIRAGKAHWGYAADWLKAVEDELTISPEQIAAWYVRTATVQGNVVGFFALACRDGEWWLEHLWLVVEHIGQGLGRELFQQAMAAAATLGATCVRIEADPNAEGFYLHMGARRHGERVSAATGRALPHLVYTLTPQDTSPHPAP
jgi:GNAT superfamily N-acetyltransferase